VLLYGREVNVNMVRKLKNVVIMFAFGTILAFVAYRFHKPVFLAKLASRLSPQSVISDLLIRKWKIYVPELMFQTLWESHVFWVWFTVRDVCVSWLYFVLNNTCFEIHWICWVVSTLCPYLYMQRMCIRNQNILNFLLCKLANAFPFSVRLSIIALSSNGKTIMWY